MLFVRFWCCNPRVFMLLCLMVCFAPVCILAQNSTNIPASTSSSLDSLKKTDNLAEWLYTRIDYSNNSRKQNLSFLMGTQKQAWRKAKSTAEKEAWLMLLSNQGYNQLFSGNILESISSYEHAYNFWLEQNINADITDFVLKPWANNYTRLGDYEKALFIQQKILDYGLKGHDNELAASAYNNMAIAYRSIGNFKKAEESIRLGMSKISGPIPASTTMTILLNNTLADIYKDKNELNNAEKTINGNILRQKKLKQDLQTAYWLLSSYITAGDIQLAKGDFKAAQNYYQLGLIINQQYYKGNRLREKAYIITQLGKVRLSQHDAKAALGYFNQTLSSLGLLNTDQSVNKQKVFGDNRIIDVFYQKAQAFLQLKNEKEALSNIQLSLFAADKIRFELADVKTRQRFQAETKQKAAQAIDIAFTLLERSGSHEYAMVILDIFEQTKARTLLDDIRRNQQQLTVQTKDSLFTYKQSLERAIAYNERELLQEPEEVNTLLKNNADLKFKLELTERKLKERYPSIGTTTDKMLAAVSLLKVLPKYAHLIAYFVYEDMVYALEIKNQRIRHVKKITGSTQIKSRITSFVSKFYHNGPAEMMDHPEAFFNASAGIYKTLLNGFNIGQQDKITIIPDEVLGYLSFDGLVAGDDYTPAISAWPYLIKKASVSYAFSIQTLLNQSQKKAMANQGFSGLFITHQNGNKQAIPAVAREATSIEKIVKGNFLLDKDADTKQFFKAFDNSSVLHISTHSYLSGAQKEPALALDDNEVFLFELSARKTAPALVVLSACRTADGMMAPGEGIISLSRGFAAIGTQGTIAGLWNVNDVAAATITADTYQNLVNGKEAGTALHLAKLNWLKRPRSGELEYLPYYWDALIYMGYDQKIVLEPAWGVLHISLMVGAGIVILGLFIYFALKRLRPKVANSAR